MIDYWNVSNQGILDYNRLNEQRLAAFHQLDLRLDKKWFFKKWNLNIFLDIENAYAFEAALPANLTLARDAITDEPLINPNDPMRYQLKELENVSGTVLPSIGLVIEL